MSTYEDNLLAARFAALAPEPLPGDWADVVGRVGARKGRRRLGHPGTFRHRRRRLLVVLAVVAFVARGQRLCVRRARLRHRQGHRRAASGGSDAEYSRERSARDVLLDPRTLPAEQELGVRRRAVDPAWCSGTEPAPRLPRATPHTRGSQAPAIRDRLGRRVRTRPAASRQHVPPTPSAIQVRKGDRLVRLRWASDLKRLEARLTNPGSWLPASAWKQPKVRAYVPSRFEVCAAAVVVPDLDKPATGARRADGSCSHRGSATGGSPERAPRQGLATSRGTRPGVPERGEGSTEAASQ